jgi:hypothetical protein
MVRRQDRDQTIFALGSRCRVCGYFDRARDEADIGAALGNISYDRPTHQFLEIDADHRMRSGEAYDRRDERFQEYRGIGMNSDLSARAPSENSLMVRFR